MISMNKLFTGRLITVIVVSILSLFFVFPTMQYYMLLRGMGENPTEAQVEKKRDMLANSSMIKPGLDLQGGVEFLISLDNELMLEREIQRLSEAILSEFRDNR